jgi:Helix-turn-helix domain
MQPEYMNARDRDDFGPLLGPADVAKWLGVSVAWVRDHATRKSPRIPAVKAGKLLRFRRVDVKDFIQDCWHAGDVRADAQPL